MAGATVVTLLARWSPIIRGHGIPEAMDAVLTRRSKVAPRTAVAKPLSAAVAIGTGGPFGAEGPIIVTGGALGSLARPGRSTSRPASARSCSPAAPRPAWPPPSARRSPPSCWPSSCCCSSSRRARSSRSSSPRASPAASTPCCSAPGRCSPCPPTSFSGLGQLPLFALLGLGCGLLAVRDLARPVRRRGTCSAGCPSATPGTRSIGAAVWASLGLLVPRALGVGYDVIDDALAGRLAIATLASAGHRQARHLVDRPRLRHVRRHARADPADQLVRSARWSASCSARPFPGLGISPTAFALVAMAATFGAAARAPFAAIVFVFELTRDYNAILPLMLATVLADLVARSAAAPQHHDREARPPGRDRAPALPRRPADHDTRASRDGRAGRHRARRRRHRDGGRRRTNQRPLHAARPRRPRASSGS